MLEGHEILDDEVYPRDKNDKKLRIAVKDRVERHFKLGKDNEKEQPLSVNINKVA